MGGDDISLSATLYSEQLPSPVSIVSGCDERYTTSRTSDHIFQFWVLQGWACRFPRHIIYQRCQSQEVTSWSRQVWLVPTKFMIKRIYNIERIRLVRNGNMVASFQPCRRALAGLYGRNSALGEVSPLRQRHEVATRRDYIRLMLMYVSGRPSALNAHRISSTFAFIPKQSESSILIQDAFRSWMVFGRAFWLRACSNF